jgi:hypothetical protein
MSPRQAGTVSRGLEALILAQSDFTTTGAPESDDQVEKWWKERVMRLLWYSML